MSDQANLALQIKELAGDEPIEAVVIGMMGWGEYGSDEVPTWNEQRRGVVLSWEEARPMLDYPYCDGHGAPNCNAVYVWTPTRVFFVSQYDGSTALEELPRHPVACEPNMPGG